MKTTPLTYEEIRLNRDEVYSQCEPGMNEIRRNDDMIIEKIEICLNDEYRSVYYERDEDGNYLYVIPSEELAEYNV